MDKKVILDAAQELQHNDEWWREFELLQNTSDCSFWQTCTEDINPFILSRVPHVFRRKPRTITVTMPVPIHSRETADSHAALYTTYASAADRDTALAAIRQAMEVGHE